MTKLPPFKSVGLIQIMSYSVGIAIKEAANEGLLTRETAERISKRADDIKDALIDGKVVQLDKAGNGTIREATPEEEIELSDRDKFPHHSKAKTTLDV